VDRRPPVTRSCLNFKGRRNVHARSHNVFAITNAAFVGNTFGVIMAKSATTTGGNAIKTWLWPASVTRRFRCQLPVRPLRMLSAEIQSFLDEIRDLPDFIRFGESVIGISSRGLFVDTPLHVAAIQGNTRMIALLLDAGAEIDARGQCGHTPLNEAVGQGHVEAVRLLLSRGADASIPNDWGQTPQQKARIGGKHEIESLFSPVA